LKLLYGELVELGIDVVPGDVLVGPFEVPVQCDHVEQDDFSLSVWVRCHAAFSNRLVRIAFICSIIIQCPLVAAGLIGNRAHQAPVPWWTRPATLPVSC